MAVSFHGIVCDLVNGQGSELKQRVLLWHTAGHNGFGAKKQGLGNSEFRYLLVKFGDNADVQTWFNLIEARQAESGAVVDDIGNTKLNLFVTEIGPPEQFTIVRGGVSEYRASIIVRGVKIK